MDKKGVDSWVARRGASAEAAEPDRSGKEGSKRHLLVDDRGVPLSLIVTGANVNDGKRLDEILSAIMVKREAPPVRRSKHLCADAGYRSGATR